MTDLNALKYTAEHEWIAIDGDVATVGITDFAAEQLGDVVFVELPAVDAGVTAGEVVGEIESTKSVGELYAPLTGDIIAVNEAAVDDPSIVNADPYGKGWLVKIRFGEQALDQLIDRAAYLAQTGGDE
jgi:glycine cleavage system H protein